MAAKEIGRGRWGVVAFAIVANGDCPAETFFDSLQRSDRIKMAVMFERTAQSGPIQNPEKFKKIDDNLFEFKSFQIRMFCFFQKGAVVVTHGCIKKRDKLDKAEIARAIRYRSEHQNLSSRTDQDRRQKKEDQKS